MCLTTKRFNDWTETQAQFEYYKSSLGPFGSEDLLEYLEVEYGDRTVFSRFDVLGLAQRARAITWANTTIPRAKLDDDIDMLFFHAVYHDGDPNFGGPDATIWTTGQEPRTRRLAELAAVLQPAHVADAETSLVSGQLRLRLDEWSRLAPDSAKQSIDRISPDHPIWRYEYPETAGP